MEGEQEIIRSEEGMKDDGSKNEPKKEVLLPLETKLLYVISLFFFPENNIHYSLK